jgi:putative nucleotidyltransferase with HDIG domain
MTTDVAAPTNPVVAKAIAQCGDISTLPEVTAKIIELVDDANSTARDLQEVIKTDPALSARILKVVNSAFYGLPGQIASVDRAIVMLGLSAVKNISITASISRMFKGQDVGGGFTAKDIWKHSVGVGVAGKIIARELEFVTAADEVFLAGLIHDIGILIERQAFPDQLTEVVERCMAAAGSFVELEEEIIGANHQQFGAELTAKWKFPKSLRAAVGMHHDPSLLAQDLREFGNIIHIADIWCCAEKIGFHLTVDHAEITDERLAIVGMTAEQLAELTEELHEQVVAAESSLAPG